MSRFRALVLVIAVALAVSLGAAKQPPGVPPTTGSVSNSSPPAATATDPFPIRRVRLTEAQLPEAVKQFDPGTLVRVPRADFESRIQKAGMVAGPRPAPRVIEAKYTASLVGSDLNGTAEWVVANPVMGPAPLSIDPLRLALRSAAWEDSREATIGVLGAGFPAGPAVWVESHGRQVLRLEWSAAGVAEQGERRFDIRVPPCPISVLDLRLPANRAPTTASPDVLVTGPFPVASDPKQQRWRFRFTGGRLEFAVRGPGAAGPGVIRAKLVTAKPDAWTYDIVPGQVRCAFTYELLPSRGAVSEWVFAADPRLHITDVRVNNRAGWRSDPGPLGLGPRWLRVGLRQPSAGGTVQVLAIAPPPAPGRFEPLPIVWPVGAVIEAEQLDIRIHPDLKLAGWSVGDYRLTESSVAADQARVMTLVGSLSPAGVEDRFRRPPTLRLADAEPEFTTREGVEWRVRDGRQWLTARIAVRVSRGPLFGLTLRVPPGYRLDAVTPADAVGHSGQPAVGEPATVEFVRPLATGQQAELQFEFRGPPVSGGASRLPLPNVTPVGATGRDGWLSIGPVPGKAVGVAADPGPLVPAEPLPGIPAPPADAVATLPFRGLEPGGWVMLTPIRPDFDAETETRIRAAGDRLAITTRITLRVRSGAITSVAVFEPEGAARGRSWRVAAGANGVLSAVPVELGGFWGTRRTFWVIRLARPATGEVVLATTMPGPLLPPNDEPVDIPRLSVCGAATEVARAELDPDLGTEWAAIIAPDRVELRPPPPARRQAPPPPVWSFTGLHLTTRVSDTQAEATIEGAVSGRAGTAFPIHLPPGSDVIAATLRGRPVALEADPAAPGSILIRLPAGIGAESVRFELRYRLPVSRGWGSFLVSSPLPGLPAVNPAVRRTWVFEPGILTASGIQSEAVRAMPTRDATAIGIGLAAVVAAAGWVGVGRAPAIVGCLLAGLLVVLGWVALVGPPAWVRVAVPPLVAGLAALGVAVLARARSRVRPTGPGPNRSGRLRAAAAAVLAFGTAVTLAAAADPPTGPETVFILPGPVNAPEEEVALVPRALLDRLTAAARPATPTAVITTAAYTGKVEEGNARVTARFTVVAFHDGETQVPLPLSDIRLEEVRADDRPALPVSVRPDLYMVAVSGRGRHTIEARFTVSVAMNGPEREVRFGVPEVPGSRLSLVAPGRAEQPQAVGRFGGQQVARVGGELRLDADLGGVRAVAVRWRQGSGGAAVVKARECCLWDVSEADAELTACYLVRVERGSVAELVFDIPADLDVVRVAVRSLDTPGGAAVLRDWRPSPDVRNGFRRLRVNLQGPTDGRLLAVIECVPRHAPTRRPVLRFPRFLPPAGSDPTDSVYGLRLTRIAVDDVARTGVIDYAADGLVRDFAAVPDLQLEIAAPLQAFRPRGGGVPELRPALRPGPDPATVITDTTWHVGPTRADANGTIRWAGKDGPLAVLEFTLGPVKVSEVRGADVASWSQSGGRVQVWFRKPVVGGTVEWIGTVPTLTGKATPGSFTFDAPAPRVADLRLGAQTVRVRPAVGWAVQPDQSRGWKQSAGGSRDWVLVPENPAAPRATARVTLVQSRPAGPARGFGLIEVNRSRVTYRGVLAIPTRPGRPQHLVVSASGLPPGATVELEPPPGVRASEHPNGKAKVWDLDVPAQEAANLRIAVVARFPAAVGNTPLPTFTAAVGGSPPAPDHDGVIRWLGLTVGGAALHLDGTRPATDAELTDVRATWPGEAERLGKTGGSVRVVPEGAVPVLVFEPPAKPKPPPTPAATPAPRPAITPAPEAPDTAAEPLSTQPDARTVGWCLAVLTVAALLVFAPRATWPEQLGLLGGLFGVAVAGGWWAGLPVVATARAVWLVRRDTHSFYT